MRSRNSCSNAVSWLVTRRSDGGVPSSGRPYANQLRRRQARPGDTWHLDEVLIRINGRQHYLWRAVDQDGNVLDVLAAGWLHIHC